MTDKYKEMYETLLTSYKALMPFVSTNHEGLGADEQANLMNHCRKIEAIAHKLQHMEVDDWTEKTIKEKIHNLQNRSV